MKVRRVVDAIMTSKPQVGLQATAWFEAMPRVDKDGPAAAAAASNCPLPPTILTCGAEAKVALAASMPMRLGGLCSGARSDAFSMVARTSSLNDGKGIPVEACSSCSRMMRPPTNAGAQHTMGDAPLQANQCRRVRQTTK